MNSVLCSEPVPNPRAPMPAPRLDNTTTTSAWPVAVRSASTSSYSSGSTETAPMSRIGKLVGRAAVAAIRRSSLRTISRSLRATLDQLVEPRHRRHRNPWTIRDRRIVRFVPCHVDALRRILRCRVLLVQHQGLLPQIPQERLQPLDPFF